MNYCRLFDGVNVTTADEHMWLIPFTEGESHWLRIDFNTETELAGMRIWNYNKNPEDTFRGVGVVILLLVGCG